MDIYLLSEVGHTFLPDFIFLYFMILRKFKKSFPKKNLNVCVVKSNIFCIYDLTFVLRNDFAM